MIRHVALGISIAAALGSVAVAGPIRRVVSSEMSANPRAGSVTADMHRAVASHVAIVAMNDRVDIRKITLHMADGRDYVVPGAMRLATGQEGVIPLPCRSRCAIDAISLEYDQRDQREGARVHIIGLDETDASRRDRHAGYDVYHPYVSYPSSSR